MSIMYPGLDSFGFTSQVRNISYNEAIGLFLYVKRTPRTTMDIAEFCEVGSDGITPKTPYSLKSDWKKILATRIVDETLCDHPAQENI
jgi:hypothetical protein